MSLSPLSVSIRAIRGPLPSLSLGASAKRCLAFLTVDGSFFLNRTKSTESTRQILPLWVHHGVPLFLRI